MTTHCMVIDRAAFEAADALQYLDEETRTWTTDGFVSALRALTEAGFYPTGIVYCGCLLYTSRSTMQAMCPMERKMDSV